jgi:WD40 repeat protein
LSNGNFVTSSADKTIKFWNLESKVHKTPFSKELVKSLAICDNCAELKMENMAGSESSFIGEEGIRCLAVSPDEKHLASGDRAGNLRVHDIDTFECVSTLPAHDTEILSLAYSCPFSDGTRFLASGSRDRYGHNKS